MKEAMPFSAHFLPQQTERLTLRRFIEADLDRFLLLPIAPNQSTAADTNTPAPVE